MTRVLTCHLCQATVEPRRALRRVTDDTFWCRDLAGCKHRARVRVGVSQWQSRAMFKADRGR